MRVNCACRMYMTYVDKDLMSEGLFPYSQHCCIIFLFIYLTGTVPVNLKSPLVVMSYNNFQTEMLSNFYVILSTQISAHFYAALMNKGQRIYLQWGIQSHSVDDELSRNWPWATTNISHSQWVKSRRDHLLIIFSHFFFPFSRHL